MVDIRAKHNVSLMNKLILLSSAIILFACTAICVYSYRATYSRLIENNNARALLIQQTMSQEILIGTAQVEKVVEELAYNRQILLAVNETDPNMFIVQLISGTEQQIRASESHLSNYGADIVMILSGRPESYDLTLDASRFLGNDEYQAFIQGGVIQKWGDIGRSLSTVEVESTVIPLLRKIVSGSGKALGSIRCDVAVDKLFSCLQQWEDGVYVIIGEQPRYFSQGDPWSLPDNLRSGIWQEGNFQYTQVEISNLSAMLLLRQDLTPLRQQALSEALFNMGAIIGVGLLVMVGAGYLISKMLRRINLMTKAVNNMPESGNLSEILPEVGPDEAGQLSKAFASLNARVNEYYGCLLKTEKSKRHAQQLALQYQINPHFLFNSMYWLQMRLEEEHVEHGLSDSIAQLGQVLHYNLESKFYASLQEEKELARAYVDFMSAVKDGTILLRMSLPDSLSETLIPRFTLQPLLENAITHGYITGKPLHLHIVFSATDSMLHIRLDNDGQQITPLKLSQLKHFLYDRSSEDQNTGVGLSNLKRRLNLVYDGQTKITIDSDNRLTTVRLSIPLAIPQKEQENTL